MHAENSWTIFPLLYLRANWSQKVYKHFDLDIRLIKAGKDTRQTLWDILQDDSAVLAPCRQGERGEMLLDVQWLLGIHLRRATEHLPPSEIGISFIDRVETSIAASFLTCLRLIRPTTVICPVPFKAKVEGDSVDNFGGCDDYFVANYEELRCEYEWPNPFKEKDIQILTELWTSVVHLRKLSLWIDEPFQETFFADLDRKTSEEVKQRLRSIFSRPDLPQKVSEVFVKDALKHKDEKDSIWSRYYADVFRENFSKKQDQVFASRTRIGRALSLFDEGLHLSPLHSFLSMCIVLETLFTLGRGEVAHKLAVRLAKIVAQKPDDPKRKDFYQRVKKVYRERGDVVHGNKLIEEVDEKVRRDSFTLARLSMRKILCSESLLEKYTGRESLEDFFVEKLDLDLK